MRDIRFRAWDSTSERMFYVDWYNDNPHKRRINVALFSDWLVQDDCFIMQYTGVKDRNEKEIYEGDIVKGIKTPEGQYTNEMIGYVAYGGMAFHFENKDMFGETTWFDTITSNYRMLSSIEVIGNIYENPELLEGNNET